MVGAATRIGIHSSIREMAKCRVLAISSSSPVSPHKVGRMMVGWGQRGRSSPYVLYKLPLPQGRPSAAFKPGMESRIPQLWMLSASRERSGQIFRGHSPMAEYGTRGSSRSSAHAGVSAKGANPPGSIDLSGQSSPPQREYFYFVDVHGRLHLEDDGKHQAIGRQKVYNIATYFKVGSSPPPLQCEGFRTFL